jgi:Coenzyme PQQ synthesis protein D (PqqD)
MQNRVCSVARKAGIFEEKLPNEVVLYDRENHRVHRLNLSMARVWEALDGTQSIEQIANILTAALGCPCDTDMALVALRQLEREGLLESAVEPEKVLPSRRELGRKFAIAGVSISLLPVLASMMAPTPAMARSVDQSFATYKADMKTAQADVAKHYNAFLHNATAQQDYSQAMIEGVKGAGDYSRGNFFAANNDYKAGEADIDNMLKSLGF